MTIDDDYCQYEMWRIVNKAEGDAIADFEKMQSDCAGCKAEGNLAQPAESANLNSTTCATSLKNATGRAVNDMELVSIAKWAERTIACKKSESDDFSEENVAASAYSQKMLELLTKNFDLVLMANIAAGTEAHLKDTGAFAAMNEEFKGLNFFERCEKYAEKVIEEDRDRFIETFNLSVLRKQIAADEVVRASYHISFNSVVVAVETIYYPISRDVALKMVRVL